CRLERLGRRCGRTRCRAEEGEASLGGAVDDQASTTRAQNPPRFGETRLPCRRIERRQDVADDRYVERLRLEGQGAPRRREGFEERPLLLCDGRGARA